MIIGRELGGLAPTSYLVSAHTHSILVGFVMMMILAWRSGSSRVPTALTCTTVPIAEAAYWLITSGTAIRTGGEMLRAIVIRLGHRGLPLIIVAGACLQVAGLGLVRYDACVAPILAGADRHRRILQQPPRLCHVPVLGAEIADRQTQGVAVGELGM